MSDVEDLYISWEQELAQTAHEPDVSLLASLEEQALELGVDLTQVPDALKAAIWDEALHPRGHDGRFIEVGGLIRLLNFKINSKKTGKDYDFSGRRGKVVSITPNKKSKELPPDIRVELLSPDGKPGVSVVVKPDQVEAAPEKARIDIPDTPDAPDLPTPDGPDETFESFSDEDLQAIGDGLRSGDVPPPTGRTVDEEIARVDAELARRQPASDAEMFEGMPIDDVEGEGFEGMPIDDVEGEGFEGMPIDDAPEAPSFVDDESLDINDRVDRLYDAAVNAEEDGDEAGAAKLWAQHDELAKQYTTSEPAEAFEGVPVDDAPEPEVSFDDIGRQVAQGTEGTFEPQNYNKMKAADADMYLAGLTPDQKAQAMDFTKKDVPARAKKFTDGELRSVYEAATDEDVMRDLKIELSRRGLLTEADTGDAPETPSSDAPGAAPLV